MAERIEMQVAVGEGTVSAVVEGAGADVVYVCAHGAGGSMSDRGMLATAKALVARGLCVVRYNFPYKEKKSGRPDPMPKLKECVIAVADHVRHELSPKKLVIGGRSMGGRAASMIAADGYSADGLLLLAYPLHPAGKPEQLRDAHLPAIAMPVLCINGTRDALCTPALMEEVLTRVGSNWTMRWEQGADHSFHVLKSSGRTDAQVLEDLARAAADWAATL